MPLEWHMHLDRLEEVASGAGEHCDASRRGLQLLGKVLLDALAVTLQTVPLLGALVVRGHTMRELLAQEGLICGSSVTVRLGVQIQTQERKRRRLDARECVDSIGQSQVVHAPINARSEERRVGKECRYRWAAYH